MQRDLVAKAPAQQSEDAANTVKCCLKIRRVARWHRGPSANEAKTAAKTAAESASSWCDVARDRTLVVDQHQESDGHAGAQLTNDRLHDRPRRCRRSTCQCPDNGCKQEGEEDREGRRGATAEESNGATTTLPRATSLNIAPAPSSSMQKDSPF